MISITTRIGTDTVVSVTAEADTIVGPLNIVGTGVARLRPGDFDVPVTGELIALGRAIQDFGRQVEERGLDESVCTCEVERVLNALLLLSGGEAVTVTVDA